MNARAPFRLCLNCLERGATGMDVGPECGSQRDPYRAQIDLCATCQGALLDADFATLADRQADERTIRRVSE